MLRKIAAAAFGAATYLIAPSASALVVVPEVGLTDFLFEFGGVGTSAFFGGDDTLEITVATPSFLTVHIEDCCIVGDEFDLVFNGSTVAWDTITGGDGSQNSMPALGDPGIYFETIIVLELLAGVNTIDLTQTLGIPGSAWINVSEVSAVPLPAALPLFMAGLGAFGAVSSRRRKSA